MADDYAAEAPGCRALGSERRLRPVRTSLVVTHQRCNQNCGFCTERRPTDDPRFIARAAVEQRIAVALAEGAEELVFTGGEPTLRGDLGALIASARARGAQRIVLETNGARLDEAAVVGLLAAGVDVFRLHLPAWGDALDAFTRTPGAGLDAARALRTIVDGGGTLELAVPLVRANHRQVAGLPAALAAAVDDPRRVSMIRASVPTSAPDRDEVLSFAEATAALAELEAAARGVGIPLKLAPGSGPPPCVFPKGALPPQLWSLTGQAQERADRVRVPECDACLVRRACAGLDAGLVRRDGFPPIEPIVDDRTRRRLSLITTVEEQIAREFLTRDRTRDPVLGAIEEVIVRVNFHCNQACEFCFVSTHLPPPGHAAVLAAIEAAAGQGARIVLSGGEPTLNPRLLDYVRLAVRPGLPALQLQTNAVRLDDEALVGALYEAGLREAFVSLHGATAETSDALTRAPGTFARTLVGVDHLHRRGVHVVLNFVICALNAPELPALVDLVAARWPTSTVNISFVAPSTDVVPRDARLVPRYSDVRPFLSEALLRAERLGLAVRGFESMCGIPLCLLPPNVGDDLADLGHDEGAGEFLRAEACTSCSARARCFGVRRGYADLHGLAELRALP